MALNAGTCTIAADKTVGGTGLARALAEAFMPALATTPGLQPLSRSTMEALFNGQAAAIVNHIVNNAEITVTVKTTDAGLQRTPNPNNPNTPTLGPSIDTDLTGSIT